MSAIVLFGEKQIRRVWNDQEQKWYFAIADIVAALTSSAAPQGYIKDMRRRDPELAKGRGQIAPIFPSRLGGKHTRNCTNAEAGIRRL